MNSRLSGSNLPASFTVRELGLARRPMSHMPWMMARTASRALLFGFLVGESEKHVDVGIREQIFASVAAQRQQGNIRRGLPGKGPTPHFNQDPVDHGRAAADRGGSIPGTLAGLADERHLPKILIP